MRIRFGLLLGLFVLLFIQSSSAQNASPLVGAWERISMNDANGAVANQARGFLIFSASGHFAQTVVPAGRPKDTKQVKDMTREELLARFQGFTARNGIYTVKGNSVTRKNIDHLNPSAEGTEEVQLFRIEDDVLILTTEGEKGEVRFRRLK